MKKIVSFLGLISVAAILFMSSCNTSRTSVCPAYPPATYGSADENSQINNNIYFESRTNISVI